MHEYFGVVGEFVIAGLCGGYICSIRMRQHRARDVVMSVVAGSMVGNYAGLVVASNTGVDPIPSAFFAGLLWNVIVHKALNYANSGTTKGRRDD